MYGSRLTSLLRPRGRGTADAPLAMRDPRCAIHHRPSAIGHRPSPTRPRDNARMTSRDAPSGDLPPSNTPSDLPLGRAVDYPREYDPALLFPIARALGRGEIGLSDDALPFTG